MENPIRNTVQAWTKFNEEHFMNSMQRVGVRNVSGNLRQTLRHQIEENVNDIRVSLFFQNYGRYIDILGKNWYNRVMMGRIYGLLRILAIRFKEKSLNIFK